MNAASSSDSVSFETPTRRPRFDSGHSSPSPEVTVRPEGGNATQHNAESTQRHQSVSAADDLNILQDRWTQVSSILKDHSQKAAELLMSQAGATSQVEDMVKQLFIQVHQRDKDKRRLEAQILQDRADFTSQAKLLSQHFTTAHHRTTALQVAHEAKQGELKSAKDKLDVSSHENEILRQQLSAMKNELVREHEQRMQVEAALQEHGAAIEEMQLELQQSRSSCEDLNAAKAQLSSQVKAMVRAEKELTESLKHTHQQIDEQLKLLREQLQQERQKRVAAVRRKGELAQQVTVLMTEVESLKESLSQVSHQQQQQHTPYRDQSGKSAPQKNTTNLRQVSMLQAALRGSLHKRTSKGIKVSMLSNKAGTQKVLKHAGYTAAFAPPTAHRASVQTPDGRSSQRSSAAPSLTATPSTSQQTPTAPSSGPIQLRSIKVVLTPPSPSIPLSSERGQIASDSLSNSFVESLAQVDTPES